MWTFLGHTTLLLQTRFRIKLFLYIIENNLAVYASLLLIIVIFIKCELYEL